MSSQDPSILQVLYQRISNTVIVGVRGIGDRFYKSNAKALNQLSTAV